MQRQKAANARQALLAKKELLREEKRKEEQSERVLSMLDFFRTGTSPYCSHLRLGSSQFLALLQRRLRAQDTHGFNKIGSDFSHGESWERWVKARGSLPLFGEEETTFEVISEAAFHHARTCRFLVASTDFKASYTRPDGGVELALFEVKTTNRPLNSRSWETGRRYQQRYQLQVALQCSEVQVGWLVFVDSKGLSQHELPDPEVRTFRVQREPDFFLRHRAQLLAGYASYLASCAAFPKTPSDHLLAFTLGQLQKKKDLLFPSSGWEESTEEVDEVKKSGKHKQRCRVNFAARDLRLSASAPSRMPGRPRLSWKERRERETRDTRPYSIKEIK